MKLLFFLQIFTVWVAPAENSTHIQNLSNSLVQRTTALVVEEYLQDIDNFRLVQDRFEADIVVTPSFIGYRRPNTDVSFSVLQVQEEEVFLTMRIEFYSVNYSFSQSLISQASLVRKAGSNFLDIEDSQNDFAESSVFNLIKKTINACFQDFDSLIF